jgi:hypothetical protein
LLEFVIPPLRDVDLAITGMTPREIARSALVSSLLGGFITLAAHSALLHINYSAGPIGLVVTLVGVPVVLYGRPFRRCRHKADELRAEVDLCAAVILDLINVQTAGGCGIETALISAAEVGQGWGFRAIRTCLSRAQVARASYWDALRDLGSAWGVVSLTDISNSGRLSGVSGSRVRQSLGTRAAALRAKNLARIETTAQQGTEKMGIPMVLLFVSFLVFVGYPALAQTMGSL